MKRRPRTALRILKGDNRETLHQVRAETVQTCVTSPPYWAVRDYDTTPLVFPAMEYRPAIGLPTYHVPAWAGQLGLEPDPWHYIGHLVATFREVRRVLRPDGTLWVNLGDTYYTGAGPAGESPGGGKRGDRHKAAVDHAPKKGRGTHADSPKHKAGATVTRYTTPNRMPLEGWKPKDLVGIPWMFAKAMQADGWTLRSDIVWHKPNPMPGSQKDRPTTAHEYVFLFSKSERYFYDNEAVKEPVVDAAASSEYHDGKTPTGWNTGDGNHRSLVGRHRTAAERGSFNGKTEAMAPTGRNAFRATRTMREKRDVWTIASRPAG
jgi:DNA modification methylase